MPSKPRNHSEKKSPSRAARQRPAGNRPSRGRVGPAKGVFAGLATIAAVAILLAAALEGDGPLVARLGPFSETDLLEALASAGDAESLAVAGSQDSVYWAGPQPGTEGYELGPGAGGGTALHYLAARGEPAGPQGDRLTIAAYPVANAQKALVRAQRQDPSLSIASHGVFEVLSGAPNNAYAVYLASPNLQIEVYSPESGEAARLAEAGALTTIE